MLAKLRTRANDAEGFTLIELLIVITILGILAAIVVFAVGTTTGNAKTAACQSDMKTTETAVEAYKAVVGSAPNSVSDLTGTATGSDGKTYGPWLKESPTYVTVASGGAVSYVAGKGCS